MAGGLLRTTRSLYGFMRRACGIVNPESACRCARRIGHAVQTGRVDPDNLLFATHPVYAASEAQAVQVTQEMEVLHRAAAVLRSHPRYAAPGAVLDSVRTILAS